MVDGPRQDQSPDAFRALDMRTERVMLPKRQTQAT